MFVPLQILASGIVYFIKHGVMYSCIFVSDVRIHQVCVEKFFLSKVFLFQIFHCSTSFQVFFILVDLSVSYSQRYFLCILVQKPPTLRSPEQTNKLPSFSNAQAEPVAKREDESSLEFSSLTLLDTGVD